VKADGLVLSTVGGSFGVVVDGAMAASVMYVVGSGNGRWPMFVFRGG
jgi:hypothetical protein